MELLRMAYVDERISREESPLLLAIGYPRTKQLLQAAWNFGPSSKEFVDALFQGERGDYK